MGTSDLKRTFRRVTPGGWIVLGIGIATILTQLFALAVQGATIETPGSVCDTRGLVVL